MDKIQPADCNDYTYTPLRVHRRQIIDASDVPFRILEQNRRIELMQQRLIALELEVTEIKRRIEREQGEL